jgi:hypothetical protein
LRSLKLARHLFGETIGSFEPGRRLDVGACIQCDDDIYITP